MRYGCLVIGPPGSGKSTFCDAMSQFLAHIRRPVKVVNLDPANDVLRYKCDIDVRELISLERVMESEDLGPNGGMLYCMDHIRVNMDWLLGKLDAVKDSYCLFDCPGQIELFTHDDAFLEITKSLSEKGSFKITVVNLVDSFYCSSPDSFISALFIALTTMLHLELPHINVLSKTDLLESRGRLDHSLEFYTQVQDLDAVVAALSRNKKTRRLGKLSSALAELVSDFSLVSFVPLDISEGSSFQQVLKLMDKANGYVHRDLESQFAKGELISTDVQFPGHHEDWLSERHSK